MNDESLATRLDRVESQLAIQQLPARYALAVDSRDVDAWLELFVEEVDCGKLGCGREALRAWIDPALRTFYRSHHQICGHVVDFVDSDHAKGTVYCRAEHEDRGRWIVMAICYFDRYERRGGRWYFAERREEHWYATDVLERPRGPNFQRWPGPWAERRPKLPALFPSWRRFWAKSDPRHVAELTSEPVGHGADAQREERS